MKECLFCKIRDREEPASFVYEDELVMAFLDINPLAKGHTLVIPRVYFENIFEIEKDVLARIMQAAKEISRRMEEVLGIGGVNIVNNSGLASEQTVFHFHLHMIPRRMGDNIDFIKGWWNARVKKNDREKLEELSTRLRV